MDSVSAKLGYTLSKDKNITKLALEYIYKNITR